METIASADGTMIAYDRGGSGPHLVLVHGMSANSSRWATFRPRLEQHFTVTAMDRRGRGGSGDHPDYALEREFEDVVAVIDAVGAPVLLLGHSYGALCALGAAMQTDQLGGLILYEPWIIGEGEHLYTREQLERLDMQLAARDREGVVKTLFAEIAGFPPEEMEMLISSPFWPERVALAHTIPREARAEETYRLPADRASNLAAPVLLLVGGDSPPLASKVRAMLEKALPDSRAFVMQGQQHMAMDTAPDLLLGGILDFWLDISHSRRSH